MANGEQNPMAEATDMNPGEVMSTLDKANVLGKKMGSTLKSQGRTLSQITGHYSLWLNLQDEIAEKGEEFDEKRLKFYKQSIADTDKLGKGIKDMLPGVAKFSSDVEATAKSFAAFGGPIALVIGLVVALAKIWVEIAKNVATIRKDLGVSATEAFKLHYEFKGLEFVGKAFGLEMSDIKASFKAARDNLGATTDEALGLSLNLAKVAMETGTTASELTTILSTMESVSSASRDVLLNQIEMNRQLIEQAGLAPGDIFSEIAQNTEFFAKFAKDGGDNMIRAGIAAKQLGLDMSAVSSISESLLNFESSIAGQLEASMLLGRAINLDRARQLALTGDQEGMMKEILKQVGGEAEFNKMNVLQRKALAKSVGVTVEQLSRLVRNNTAGAVGTAAGAAAGRASENVFSNPEGERLLGKIARNTEGL